MIHHVAHVIMVTDVFIEITAAIIVDVVQDRIRSELFCSKRHQFIKCILCTLHAECNPGGSHKTVAIAFHRDDVLIL